MRSAFPGVTSAPLRTSAPGSRLWDYAERSARSVSGSSFGNPLADELLPQLRRNPEGLTRADIRDGSWSHAPRSLIGRALRSVQANRLVRMEKIPTPGRPEERWFAVEPSEEDAAPPRSNEDARVSSHSSIPSPCETFSGDELWDSR